MPQVSFWNDERYAIVQALRAKGVSWRNIAIECNALWGTAFTGDAVRVGQRCAPAGMRPAEVPKPQPPPAPVRDSGTPNARHVVDVPVKIAQPSPPPLDDVEIIEELGKEALPTADAGQGSFPAPWVRKRLDHYLIVSDLQMPYHHPGALDFCKRVRVEYNIPIENILCAGDEFDFYWLSRFDHSPDAEHSPVSELEAGRAEASRWKAAFPHMRICESNHVHGRIKGAASRGGLASAWIRSVREVFDLPETWRWAPFWIVPTKHPFRTEHGHMKPGGHSGLRNRPTNRGISTAWGHEHAEPATIHVDTAGGQQVWGMRTGSLLTREPVAALSYNAEDASRPVGSVGVVLDDGRTPLIVRM